MITVTQNAVEHIKKIQGNMKSEGKFLRVSVRDGGCSGNQYKIDFDMDSENDTKISSNGVTIILDKHSLPLVKGMELDYVESLEGSSFIFNNPNSTGQCGCGQSFSV